MSVGRIVAIGTIYLAACAGWVILGATTAFRSTEFSGRLGAEVEALWGTPLVQAAPSLAVEIPGSDRVRTLMPAKNDVAVELKTDYRKKGLIWYPTYTCQFAGTYTITNNEKVAQKARLHFRFPSQGGTYDAFTMHLDDQPFGGAVDTKEGIHELVELAPGQSTDFKISYKTRGIREWRYKMDPTVGRVQNLNLAVKTDFRKVDYPDGCLSPMSSQDADNGKLLTWQATDLITKEDVGVLIPEKLNPGPLTSRITFFAPVCLLFFFVLVATINILYQVKIHPMHYLFVAAGFFAFHLLLAYMVGPITIHVAFVISAVVSVTLVTGYLCAALRGEFPWKIAAAGQLFFLVLFSYSFFFKGMTGLTVAIGSVVTLAVLMKVTAHVNWDDVFPKKTRHPTSELLPSVGLSRSPAPENPGR
ncbi:MAG: inner membrane CreD family protein [Candidatus Hydrogenedentes bacterium]|nr:inner membrane CreD family protein [Candidatus Hydrogenedentota bacterium]